LLREHKCTYLLTYVQVGFFSNGDTIACFCESGSRPSASDALTMPVMYGRSKHFAYQEGWCWIKRTGLGRRRHYASDLRGCAWSKWWQCWRRSRHDLGRW